ncbi:PREDICTED: epoxide hydrolase 3-like isoform X2 [Ipomoea nil]|uniref:epoxide hydrolase 3-like isoform X2 n=1 Tax=Ipomoea nil TaxID=35883 RepID=UPI000901CAB8|nr:PREDICTED: epoxide hydrolase 3-like isoform X2 [Ipomoea nil]
MVNFVEAQKSLLHFVMKMAGVIPHAVEIQPGTVMNIWVPIGTIKTPKKRNKLATTIPTSNAGVVVTSSDAAKPSKPVVVLLHGFAGEGILTWQFQVGWLKKYAIYVPDLLFFGGSVTDSADRSPAFQAECLAKGLRKLGVEKCTVVGFSYGGMVAFKMAELFPELVEALVVSGAIMATTDDIITHMVNSLGFSTSSDMLLPTSVKGLKALFKVATYRKLRIPNRFYKDFLEVMYGNRKERSELLEGMVVSKDITIPAFPQETRKQDDVSRHKESGSPGSPRAALRLQQVSQAVPCFPVWR